ncbi:hypothetical protein PIB30_012153 [Stylosanthes scabra]|uniref:RNase H type-1 domain-containing protein n=1 Tax=Stylosanthes scabra TaxID=79078 RepID=A0ABU6T5Q5_9FABA|nr:hypothetical protein [Stylosanthes scabra]
MLPNYGGCVYVGEESIGWDVKTLGIGLNVGNQRIFENKIIDWVGAWELVNALISSWEVGKKKTVEMGAIERGLVVNNVPTWWHCCYYDTVGNKYIVGGYYTDVLGDTVVFIGEECLFTSKGEATIYGLECALQFMLEELNDRSENLVLISNRKDVVNWINGKQDTGWDHIFLRNKVTNKRQVFDEVKVMFKQDNEFIAKGQWEELAKDNLGRWIRWI